MKNETGKHENLNASKGAENKKNLFYIGGSILGIGIIVFAITFVLYGNKIEEENEDASGKIASLMQEAASNTESASTQMGKTVEEAKNEMEQNSVNTNSVNNANASNVNKTNTTKTNTTSKSTANTTKNANTVTKQETTETKALTFIKPVDGEISKQYAKDNLLYSETLEEWTTHLGIDIKAEKTTVVKASADGKVKSIKNDPRYGLTIIIEHQDGYETLYANLLTSEFVQVGEEVKQGQSIGTVGNTATFEILDDAHLHFEISKNGETQDPNEFIK